MTGPSEGSARPGGTPVVLVVEPDPVERRVALLTLRALGCRVEQAADGRTAVEMVLGGSIDLVLMSCRPDFDGYHAAAAIRARQLGRRTPIVAVTEQGAPLDRARAARSGLDHHLGKPLEADRLRAALDRWAPGPGPLVAPRPRWEREAAEAGLDVESLAALLDPEQGGGPELVAEMCSLLLRDLPPRLRALRAAIEAGDETGTVREAHAIRGSCTSLGLAAIARAATALERPDPAQPVAPPEALLRELEAAFQRARPLISRWATAGPA